MAAKGFVGNNIGIASDALAAFENQKIVSFTQRKQGKDKIFVRVQ